MIKLKDLTCEKCFYARRSPNSFAVSEKLVECRRYPNAVMKGKDFGCGEGIWSIEYYSDLTDVLQKDSLGWGVFSKYKDSEWLRVWRISDPWWMEQ